MIFARAAERAGPISNQEEIRNTCRRCCCCCRRSRNPRPPSLSCSSSASRCLCPTVCALEQTPKSPPWAGADSACCARPLDVMPFALLSPAFVFHAAATTAFAHVAASDLVSRLTQPLRLSPSAVAIRATFRSTSLGQLLDRNASLRFAAVVAPQLLGIRLLLLRRRRRRRRSRHKLGV